MLLLLNNVLEHNLSALSPQSTVDNYGSYLEEYQDRKNRRKYVAPNLSKAALFLWLFPFYLTSCVDVRLGQTWQVRMDGQGDINSPGAQGGYIVNWPEPLIEIPLGQEVTFVSLIDAARKGDLYQVSSILESDEDK